ncbi:hypothetical protein QFC22_005572 [Naganishia vaughanmartiniae]|uniref:Uncharacterized protein n=1 Tax=Naganishia vaughanmartiniae TaxID=1424756 RepID=A0ACC2WTE9_9TREE|nr:hypothetical protein QFC22_005572 [Naganishia vaughanmartiniae]
MDSYPWEPAQTTSGIVKDPTVGARLVPKSVRKDGSQRKELRIRDGYVPLEDRVAYKSRGKLEAERLKGFVPGATSATPSTYAIPSGKANDPTQGMSKAQKKNYQRKIKKLEEKTARNWDSEDDDDDESDDDDDRGAYKAKDPSELNDQFDVHEDSDDAQLDAAIDDIEVPELGVKPEFGVGFNKQRDMVKGSSRPETKPSGIARPPRPGGIFRDLGLKPKSSTSTDTLTTPSTETTRQTSSTPPNPPATKPVPAPPAANTTRPSSSQSKRTVPGAASKPSTSSGGKDSPRARPEVKVRPGHSLAGMMKQLAVQDTTPGVRR